MNAAALGFGGSGRVLTTANLPKQIAPFSMPFADGPICVAIGVAPRSWNGGIPYGPNGRICIEDVNTVAITGFHSGMPFTAAGKIACDRTGAIHHYVRGWPVTAEGRIAIQ